MIIAVDLLILSFVLGIVLWECRAALLGLWVVWFLEAWPRLCAFYIFSLCSFLVWALALLMYVWTKKRKEMHNDKKKDNCAIREPIKQDQDCVQKICDSRK